MDRLVKVGIPLGLQFIYVGSTQQLYQLHKLQRGILMYTFLIVCHQMSQDIRNLKTKKNLWLCSVLNV